MIVLGRMEIRRSIPALRLGSAKVLSIFGYSSMQTSAVQVYLSPRPREDEAGMNNLSTETESVVGMGRHSKRSVASKRSSQKKTGVENVEGNDN